MEETTQEQNPEVSAETQETTEQVTETTPEVEPEKPKKKRAQSEAPTEQAQPQVPQAPAAPTRAPEVEPEEEDAPAVEEKRESFAEHILSKLQSHKVDVIWNQVKSYIAQGLPAKTAMHLTLEAIEKELVRTGHI